MVSASCGCSAHPTRGLQGERGQTSSTARLRERRPRVSLRVWADEDLLVAAAVCCEYLEDRGKVVEGDDSGDKRRDVDCA
jgi:hypothetical protein